ncbi:hypothetical protein ELZ14_24295 [Pseudomonas brassicacearum]|nr:hypothetical protein ELZ14_24295 [Pseudomonas brassicacearum]
MLAMTPAHSTSMWLAHHIREQARSHNELMRPQAIRFSEQNPSVSSVNRMKQVAKNPKQNINYL